MFSASATTITKVQIFTGLFAITGILYFDFDTTNVITTIVCFYLYSIIGVSLTLHRYYSHKSFEFKSAALKWVCTLVAILTGRGSPLGWVYVHRLHHAYSDQDGDPHSPHNLGFKLFGFRHIEDHSGKMKVFLVKELMTKEQLFINKWYFAIILAWLVLLGCINISLIYFAWILPVMLVQLSQNCFNYFAHMHGHRNFETKDTSTNNIWLWPFILGDAWHNNHHANAARYETKVLWWEFDPVSALIAVIKK
jgi:stearoyl-CoA desaturase (delta-9 desaturase)